MYNDNYDISKDMLNTIRNKRLVARINEDLKRTFKQLLKEGEESKSKCIAITNDARFGQNVLQHQIDSFKQTVNNGAKFSDENPDKPESNPLVYFPETGNLVFSGSIPTLGDMKFQYSLTDVTEAPYVWAEGLSLSESVIDTLNKMRGHYLNWRDEFLEASDMLDKIK